MLTLTVLTLGVSATNATGQIDSQRLRLQGCVVDAVTGLPLRGTTIEIVGRSTVSTDSAGLFVMATLPPGPYVVHARHLGYQEAVDTVVLGNQDINELRFLLRRSPVQLQEITISGKAVRYLPAFDAPYKRAASGRGYFITREDVDAWNARDYQTLLNRVPGVRANDRGITFVRCQAGLEGTQRWNAKAKVQVWIDGFRVSESADPMSVYDVLRTVPPHSIQIMEIYTSVATIPAEFLSDACAVIVIWTKRD